MKRIGDISICFLFLVLIGCTEPFPVESIEFEETLVVESTITNEMKKQVVKVSRTIPLESFGQEIEDNATVRIEVSDGTTFDFSQDVETGSYISNMEFQAIADVDYTLKIITADGRSYSSSAVTMTPIVEIDRIYSELVSENGIEGIQVFVDAGNITNDAKYFRYEYEETYKVQLPSVAKFNFEIQNFSEFTGAFDLVTTPIEDWPDRDVCYPSFSSIGVIQISTANLGENQILRFPVRFISKSSPILRERYSILVKQYVQSQEAFIFYQILEDLGNVESLLSQGQPGFVTGNITSDIDSEERVLGFFEATSVSTERIYFDYTDFGLELPPYFVECEDLASNIISSRELRQKLAFEGYQIFFFEKKPVDGGTPRPIYHIAQSECTECAILF